MALPTSTNWHRLRAIIAHDAPMENALAAFEAARRRRLALRSGSRTFLVDIEQVDWVEAAGNYLVFHVGRERLTVRLTMREMEPRLQSANIVRIHKSTFVNLDRVKSIEPIHAGDHVVTLLDGTELVMSRTYRSRVNAALFLDDPPR
jgi:two-component system LytT family response regulator